MSVSPRSLSRARPLMVGCLVLLALVTCSCASRQNPLRVVRLAVLDGRLDYEVKAKGEVRDEGWWFSAADRYVSGNVGIQMAEALSKEFGKIPGVEVYSRDDLTIYMAQKERALKRNFPDLTSLDRKQLLLRQDPIDYGKSLNVDYVMTTDVLQASTVTNRTFSWWYSHLDVIVQLYDVSKGQLVWTRPWNDSDAFDSQLALVEECARETARRARREDVFRVKLAQ